MARELQVLLDLNIILDVLLEYRDFEDGVQMAAAEQAGADYLVTRNVKDFVSGSVPVVQPAELLALWNNQSQDPTG